MLSHVLSKRTIIGWLRWWLPHPLFSINLYHQPTLSDLYWTSIIIHPLYCCHLQTIILIIAITNQNHMTPTAAHLGPHSLCTCSMSHAYHTTHNTHSRGHEFGHHMTYSIQAPSLTLILPQLLISMSFLQLMPPGILWGMVYNQFLRLLLLVASFSRGILVVESDIVSVYLYTSLSKCNVLRWVRWLL